MGPARTARDGRGGPVRCRGGGLIGARVPIPKDGFPSLLVTALEVLLLNGLLVGKDAIGVLLGRLRAGEDDDLSDALELFRDEARRGRAEAAVFPGLRL